MEAMLQYAAAAIVAYLLGAIPFGYIAGRVRGIDVRQHGSGRTGGTNVLRTAGQWAALFTVIGDIVKGATAVLFAKWLIGSPAAEMIAAVLVIIGHNYSLFLGWRGGAGVGPATGTLLVIAPWVVASCVMVFVIVVVVSRYVSLGSIMVALLAAILLLAQVAIQRGPVEFIAYALLGAGIIIYAHRPNIQRLLAGTERKLSK
jgi:glycerol-3-phosphate acyltransferase PlsY